MNRKSHRKHLALAIVAISAVIVASGAGRVHACNQLENPGFDGSLDPWEVVGGWAQGTWSWQPAVGNDQPGSAHCVDAESCTILQCANVSAFSHPTAATYHMYLTHGGNVGTMMLRAWSFPDPSCATSGQVLNWQDTFTPPTAWTDYAAGFTTLGNTQSILVEYSASAVFGGPAISVNMDDAGLCLESAGLIFSDGFESGNSSAWSGD